MGAHLVPALHHLVPMRVSVWIQFVLATPVVLWAGWPFFVRGWASLRSGHFNMFTLIAIGVGAAFLYSLVATVAPELFPAGFRGHGGMVPVYYEAAGVVVALVLLGQVLELRARAATGRAIRALLNLAPKTARRIAADLRPVMLDDLGLAEAGVQRIGGAEQFQHRARRDHPAPVAFDHRRAQHVDPLAARDEVAAREAQDAGDERAGRRVAGVAQHGRGD